jgi:hypothetical protein
MAGILIGGFLWNAVTGGGSSHTRNVSRASYAGEWPLIVDSATIGCDGHNPWVRIGADFYALTGAGRASGYKDIDLIWAYDPAAAGLRVNIAPLRADALKLC